MSNVINVGLIGYGVVGKGTVEALIKNRKTILEKSGIEINVHGIADLRINERTDDLLSNVAVKTTNAEDLISNPDIDIIIELVGGYDFPKKIITAAIAKGKHVVTANKALLAVHGKEIFKMAVDRNVEIGFEASVGGGIPILKVLKEDLVANNILQIEAIINGTANYILTRMQNEGKDYSEVLKDAQALGYAEADPTFDVEGVDSAHKLTLLASIAFGTWVNFDDVFTEGITQISSVDINFAKELDCTIKLLAIAKRTEDGIEVRVHPTMIPNSYQLASVNDVFNAVQVKGDMVGTTLHYGRGAGGLPTGSAVAADVVNIARNIKCGAVNCVNPLGFERDIESRIKIISINDIESAFYLRFMAEDAPGVLSTIAGILAKNGISIRSAIQQPMQDSTNDMPLVFLTHVTKGNKISKAIEEIDKLTSVKTKTTVIRVQGVH